MTSTTFGLNPTLDTIPSQSNILNDSKVTKSTRTLPNMLSVDEKILQVKGTINLTWFAEPDLRRLRFEIDEMIESGMKKSTIRHDRGPVNVKLIKIQVASLHFNKAELRRLPFEITEIIDSRATVTAGRLRHDLIMELDAYVEYAVEKRANDILSRVEMISGKLQEPSEGTNVEYGGNGDRDVNAASGGGTDGRDGNMDEPGRTDDQVSNLASGRWEDGGRVRQANTV